MSLVLLAVPVLGIPERKEREKEETHERLRAQRQRVAVARCVINPVNNPFGNIEGD